MAEHDSLSDALRAVPRLWKLLSVLAVVLGSAATSGVGFALWRDGMATDLEVDGKIERHNARPRDADDPQNSPHPTYARTAQAFEAHRQAAERDQRAAKRRDQKILEYLVSIQAADLETNRKRKADAAAFARTAFRAAVKAGAEPEDAAEQALDSPPPWRR